MLVIYVLVLWNPDSGFGLLLPDFYLFPSHQCFKYFIQSFKEMQELSLQNTDKASWQSAHKAVCKYFEATKQKVLTETIT